MTSVHSLGDWRFLPASHELCRDGETVRLEYRAAALLALLSERRGEIVSRREIIEHVWGGRQVSANSIPVVIADLRRALGDDARHPRFLETVSKRGYRLLAASTALPRREGNGIARWRPIAAIAIAVTALGGLTAVTLTARRAPVVLVEDVRNQTGDRNYDALAAASGELIVGDLARHGEIEVARDPAAAADVRLRLRMVLWNGNTGVSAEALDVHTGRVIYAVRAFGAPQQMPLLLRRLSGNLAAALSTAYSPFRPLSPGTT